MKKIDISILFPQCSFEQTWNLDQVQESVVEMNRELATYGCKDLETRMQTVVQHIDCMAQSLADQTIEEDAALSLISGDCFYLYLQTTEEAMLDNCVGLVVYYANGGINFGNFDDRDEFENAAKMIQDIGVKLSEDQTASYDALTSDIVKKLRPTIH